MFPDGWLEGVRCLTALGLISIYATGLLILDRFDEKRKAKRDKEMRGFFK